MTERNNQSLKHWDNNDKPREKLLTLGKKNLSNAELTAILLGSGTPGQSVVGLAQEILDYCGNSLSALSSCNLSELKRFKGIGEAKAITLIAAFELGCRLSNETNKRQDSFIRNSQDLFNDAAKMLIGLPNEEFWAIYLSNNNRVLGRQRIAQGGITQTSVDVRLIYRGAIERDAVAIALMHNHPSGNLQPSQMDKALTNDIVQGCSTLNLKLIDHIIVSTLDSKQNDYYSFRENGLL